MWKGKLSAAYCPICWHLFREEAKSYWNNKNAHLVFTTVRTATWCWLQVLFLCQSSIYSSHTPELGILGWAQVEWLIIAQWCFRFLLFLSCPRSITKPAGFHLFRLEYAIGVERSRSWNVLHLSWTCSYNFHVQTSCKLSITCRIECASYELTN